jgi:hypothetical protein
MDKKIMNDTYNLMSDKIEFDARFPPKDFQHMSIDEMEERMKYMEDIIISKYLQEIADFTCEI